MDTNYQNWEYQDFIDFIIYHASMADFKFSDDEKELLLKYMDQQKLNQIRHLHKSNSDFQNIQIILHFKDIYCKNADDTDKVKATIKEVFDSDGDYNMHEKTMKAAFDLLFRL
jgi:hypothetical protein